MPPSLRRAAGTPTVAATPVCRKFLPYWPRMRSVVALVGERVAAFELGIVCQVFGLDRSDDGPARVRLRRVRARTPGEVPTTSGFTVRVDRTAWTGSRAADLVTVPAWPTLDEPVDPAVLDALRAAVDRGARVLSVCSGAFALAAAGLLDGRRAATHWQFADRLAAPVPGGPGGPRRALRRRRPGADQRGRRGRHRRVPAPGPRDPRRRAPRTSWPAAWWCPPTATAARPSSSTCPCRPPRVDYVLADLLDWMSEHLDRAADRRRPGGPRA